MANIVKWALRPGRLRAKMKRREVGAPSHLATLSNELCIQRAGPYSRGPAHPVFNAAL